MEYKVGQIITNEYKDAPLHPSKQFKTGSKANIFDEKTKMKIATFEVLETDEYKVTGKIITTYGHRRKHR